MAVMWPYIVAVSIKFIAGGIGGGEDTTESGHIGLISKDHAYSKS